MKNTILVKGTLAFALVFGLLVAGCSDGSSGGGGGGGGGGDPVKVNLSLPNIKEVASFDGEFVSSEDEALDLVSEALNELGTFTGSLFDDIDIDMDFPGGVPLPSISSYSRSRSAVNYNEPIDYSFEEGEIAEGVTAAFFVKGYAKEFAADEYDIARGDFSEVSLKLKLALDLDDITQDEVKFNGKYYFDVNMFMKDTVTRVSPTLQEKLDLKFNAKNGYALSVSKNGHGLKFVMKLTANLNGTWKDDDPSATIDALSKLGFTLTIDIYDNNNTKKYARVIKDIAELMNYVDIEDIMSQFIDE